MKTIKFIPFIKKFYYKFILVIFIATTLSVIGTVAYAKKRINCSSFIDQSEAQKYFESGKRGSSSLDRDKDGEACECLIGGSKANKKTCIYWRKKHQPKSISRQHSKN